MISLGVELGLLAVRVTIVSLTALGLLCVCRRRGARSAVVLLAAAMTLLLILPAITLLPLPDQWRWAVADDGVADTPSAANPQSAAGSTDEEAATVSLLQHTIRWLATWKGGEPTPARLWGWTTVAGLYLLVLCACGLRLMVAWKELVMLRRRSRLLTDPKLLQLADELCTCLGSHIRSVELRESDDIGPAATFGWVRPVILLASDWRSWSDEERRAVLAHELAHVRHRDFVLGVLAGLCKVLHFYHPLVRWLARRMSWHQEVAADDLAATVAGGRSEYLKTLARLALRLPARMPVATSLSLPAMTGGTILRRIDMLCRTEQRPMRPVVRGVLIALLAATAVGASAWRGPAETIVSESPAEDVPPFELGYLPPEAKGIVAARPSIWIRQPGLDKVREQIDDLFEKLKKEEGIDLPSILKPHNIEQFVGNLHLTTAGTGKPGTRGVMVGTSSFFIRFHTELDAPALLRPFVPDMKVTRKGEITVCHLGTIPIMGPQPVSMLVLNRRTVVFLLHKNLKDDEEAAAKHIDAVLARMEVARQRDWGSGWKQVERAPLAVVVDNTDGGYQKTFVKDLEEAPEMQSLLDNVRFATLGVELGDGRPMRVVLDALSPAAAKVLEKASMVWLRKEVAEALKVAAPDDPADKARRKWSTEIHHQGRSAPEVPRSTNQHFGGRSQARQE